jgi:hypothetical protein
MQQGVAPTLPALRPPPALQGVQGLLYDCAQSGGPLLQALDLRSLPALRAPRLWSALHDALLYVAKADCSGGRVRAIWDLGAALAVMHMGCGALLLLASLPPARRPLAWFVVGQLDRLYASGRGGHQFDCASQHGCTPC